MPAETEALIDGIYEAAAVPELWPSALDRVGRAIGATDGLLATARWNDVLRVVAKSPHLMETWDLINSRFPSASNERTRRVIRSGNFGFITDMDVFDEGELRRDSLYSEILIPRGYGSGVATAISAPSGDFIIVNMERSFEAGPFDRRAVAQLDGMRPHFARAALVSARLEMERAAGALRALELLDLPAAVLGRGGKALATNDLLCRLMPDRVIDLPSRLALRHPAADRLLGEALEALDKAPHGAAVRSIALPGRDGQPPIVVHLTPIRGAAHDIFARAIALLVATPVAAGHVPSATVVQGLFDLTPSEARLAVLIAAGHAPRDAAERLGWTYETARTTLKRVMAKVGVERQAELAGLLAGAGTGPSPSR